MSSVAEITLFMWSLALGLPSPLFPIQPLRLNLVTNGVREPAEGNELRQQPRPTNPPTYDRHMLNGVLVNTAYMGSLAFAVFFALLHWGIAAS
jgi:Ca2+-transporting ATPase